jgi:hypothetical protein
MVEGQLELLLLVRKAEEVVRRLELAITDDWQLSPKLHPERLVENPTPLGIGHAHTLVQKISDPRAPCRRVLETRQRVRAADATLDAIVCSRSPSSE